MELTPFVRFHSDDVAGLQQRSGGYYVFTGASGPSRESLAGRDRYYKAARFKHMCNDAPPVSASKRWSDGKRNYS